MQNIPDNLYDVLRKGGMTEPKECYANCSAAVIHKYFETYVLGLAKLPSEADFVRHAWVEDNNISYDPTLQRQQLHTQTTYKALHRLNRDELIHVIKCHYGSAELKHRTDNKIGFNPPILTHEGNITIIDE